MTADGYQASFEDDENVLKLTMVMVAQPSEYTKAFELKICLRILNFLC